MTGQLTGKVVKTQRQVMGGGPGATTKINIDCDWMYKMHLMINYCSFWMRLDQRFSERHNVNERFVNGAMLRKDKQVS